jgi:hypothetical protein
MASFSFTTPFPGMTSVPNVLLPNVFPMCSSISFTKPFPGITRSHSIYREHILSMNNTFL